MVNDPLRRAFILMLLGMGSFFIIATLLAVLVWLTVTDWRLYIQQIALLAALVAIPVAFYLRSRFLQS